MQYVLLIGAAYNVLGALPLFMNCARILSAPAGDADRSLNVMLFTGGTAFVFASLYVYLFFNPAHVFPFLIFGASLKTWAFVLSSYLYVRKRTDLRTLIAFGMGNGIIAALFWLYLSSL